MELDEKSPDALSEVLSRAEISCDENTSGKSSENVVDTSNTTSEFDDIPEEESYSVYDTDSDTTDREEWLEENYLHESLPKISSRQKNTSDNQQKFSTYRKTSSREQMERKFPSSYYKLDQQTILALEKLIDVRPIGQYHEVIGKGKNSIVISIGQRDIQHRFLSRSLVNAIKIYKLTNDDNLNKAIYKRVEREYKHMCKITWAVWQIPVPAFKHNNILVMSIIGTKEEPAMPLSKITPDYCEDAYDEIVNDLYYFYHYGCVHGNLSTTNVLIWRKTLFYVGWSKASLGESPLALESLMRDCCFVSKFFKSKGVSHVMPIEAIFKKVTQLKDVSPELLEVIQKMEPTRKRRGNPNSKKRKPAVITNCRFK